MRFCQKWLDGITVRVRLGTFGFGLRLDLLSLWTMLARQSMGILSFGLAKISYLFQNSRGLISVHFGLVIAYEPVS